MIQVGNLGNRTEELQVRRPGSGPHQAEIHEAVVDPGDAEEDDGYRYIAISE